MLRNSIVYVGFVMLVSVVVGHAYYQWISGGAYTSRPWGYEYSGSIAIVTMLAIVFGGVMGVIGGVWYAIKHVEACRIVVANAVVSTILYAVILITCVFNIVPLDIWDRKWAVFMTLTALAACVAHCIGYAVCASVFRRGQSGNAIH